jgi:hypothetical protein
MDSSSGCTSTTLLGTVNTYNGSNTTATIANTFVNFQSNGTGNYHFVGGAFAIGAGTQSCASGGVSPCTPTTDFDGNARTAPLSIGAYE